MKKYLTLLLVVLAGIVKGQTRQNSDSLTWHLSDTSTLFIRSHTFLTPVIKNDTIPAYGYCLYTTKMQPYWIKAYAVAGWSCMAVIYEQEGIGYYKIYLSNDRKTKAIDKIIYSVKRENKFKP